MDLTSFTILAVLFVLLCAALYRWYYYEKPSARREAPEVGEATRQMPDIEVGVEIPEEDQQYLQPITVAVLKKLAFSKRMAPTNAMLMEHLAEALSEAAQSFTARKNNSQNAETGNEDWLFVAAFAIRLYDEGTPHNCPEVRDGWITQGTLSSRRLQQWANRVNNEIARMVKEGTVGKDQVRDVTSHASTVGGTPYTADEIEDMKRGGGQ